MLALPLQAWLHYCWVRPHRAHSCSWRLMIAHWWLAKTDLCCLSGWQITQNRWWTLTHKLCPPPSTLPVLKVRLLYLQSKWDFICLPPPLQLLTKKRRKKRKRKALLSARHTPTHSLNVFALAKLSMWHKVIQRPTQSQKECYSVKAGKLLLGNALCGVWKAEYIPQLYAALLCPPPSIPHGPPCDRSVYLLALTTRERKSLELWKPCSIVGFSEVWLVFASGGVVSINDKMPVVRYMKTNSKQ